MGYLRSLTPITVLASLLIGPLAKAESPQLLPTRDMDITYDVTLPSQPRVRERVRWLAAEQLERVDGPHKSTTIFNRRTREIIHLSLADRTFRQLDMPRRPEEPAPEVILKRGNEFSRCGIALRELVLDRRRGNAHCVPDGRWRAASISYRRQAGFGGAFGKLSRSTG